MKLMDEPIEGGASTNLALCSHAILTLSRCCIIDDETEERLFDALMLRLGREHFQNLADAYRRATP